MPGVSGGGEPPEPVTEGTLAEGTLCVLAYSVEVIYVIMPCRQTERPLEKGCYLI